MVMSLELEAGLGRVTWWGFSPWTSLTGRSALVVGAGDPRHLVRSLADSGGPGQSREFFLLEQNIQVYCRQVRAHISQFVLATYKAVLRKGQIG